MVAGIVALLFLCVAFPAGGDEARAAAPVKAPAKAPAKATAPVKLAPPPPAPPPTPAPPPVVLTAPVWERLFEYRGGVTLQWLRVQGAAAYIVQRRVGEQGEFREVARPEHPQFEDSATFPGEVVFYRIIPLDGVGRPGPMSEVRYLKEESVQKDELPPPAWGPQQARKEGVALTWSHPSPDSLIAYNVYRRSGPKDPWTLLTSTTDTFFLDRSVSPGKTFYYGLTAINRALQESETSEPLKVTFTPPAAETRPTRAMQITALDEVTSPTERIRTFGPEVYGFISPVDVAWRRDKGFLYVSDTGTSLVTIIDARGEVVMRLGGKGTAPGNIEHLLGIALDGEGTLFATDAYRGEIVAFRPDGGFLKRILLLEQVKKWFGRDFASRFPAFRFGLVDLVPTPGGGLLVVDNPNGWIYVLDGRGQLVDIWGEKGELEGQFHYPTFILPGEEGGLLVSDTLNSRLQVLDADGKSRRVIGTRGLEVSRMLRPKGLARDSRGFLFVADSYHNVIQVFDREGNFVAVLGDEKKLRLDLAFPNGMTVMGEDLLVVAEKGARRVTVLRPLITSRSLFFSQRTEGAPALPAGEVTDAAQAAARIRGLKEGGTLTLRIPIFAPGSAEPVAGFAPVFSELGRLARDPGVSLEIRFFAKAPDRAAAEALAGKRLQRARGSYPILGERAKLETPAPAPGQIAEDRVEVTAVKSP